ncbi:cold shock small protein YmcF [Escherichia coli]|uniref:cold shock small protein YmcF n=1 Tax=Escherichia coli TaxID=562 RepID=UPI000DD97501|nr:cold-shock protein [Escherichia coli]EEW8734766.1 cold-shock protein [Escherichia coli]EFT3133431.1 cold-shock protein [Escherichia coli]
MTNHIHFRCPCCHGSQYRTSSFDVSDRNPFGAKCIFCKSMMITFDNISQLDLPLYFQTSVIT